MAGAAELTTSTWDDWFTDDGSIVWVRLHYPAQSDRYGADADPSAGPYPAVVFMHGWLGSAWMYDDVCARIAAQGYVVVNMDTETLPWIDTDALADDAHAALYWLDEASNNSDHWLSGMTDGGDWIAMGHSMGGIAMGRLVSMEPRVQTVVGFMPYEPEGDEHDAYLDFEGSAMFLAGTEDETSIPAYVEGWYDHLSAPQRGLLYAIEGAGHQAVTDFEWGGESMDDALQRDVVVSMASDFLAAEVRGEEDRFGRLLCDLPADMATRRSASAAPATWAEATSSRIVRAGIAGQEASTAVLYAGRGPGSTDTAHGTVGLRSAVEVAQVELADGVACLSFDIPADLDGIGWIQAAIEHDSGVTLGRTVDVFGVGDPGPEPEAEDTDPDPGGVGTELPESTPAGNTAGVDTTGSEPKQAGCAAAPRAPWHLGWLVLGALLWRRR